MVTPLGRELTRQREAREAAEAVQATPITPTPVQPQTTPEAAPEEAEETVRQRADSSQEQQGEEGWISQVGNYIMDQFDPLNTIDRNAENLADLTQNIPVVGQVNRAVADFIPDRETLDEGIADIPVLGQIRAAGAGADAFIMTPLTAAARIADQSTEFSEMPAELEDVVGGEIAFEIGRIVAPSLMGLPPVQSMVARVGAESALETINQRSADDLVLGREVAIKVGELYESMGGDGKQLTQDLIEGRKPEAQAMVAVAGFLQNMSINISAELLFGRIGKLLGRTQVDESVERVARATGRSTDEVAASLDNVSLPNKGSDYDINEAVTLDTGVPLPDKGNEVINSDALLQTAVRRGDTPFSTDAANSAQSSYFTNLERFTDTASYRRALDEATSTLDRLPKGSVERDQVLLSARAWVREFLDESGTRLDIDRALVDYPYGELIEDLKADAVFSKSNPEKYLKEEAINTPKGAVVATIIGEDLSMRLHRQARGIMNLENGNKDWTAAIENYISLQDKTNLFLVPLRRFQRRFHVSGEVLQRQSTAKVKGNRPIKDAKKTSVDRTTTSPSRDFSLIRKTPDDEGRTIKELLDAYKAGDKDAGNTLKTYFAVLSHASPKTAIAQMDNLQDVLLKELKSGNHAASRQLLYAGFLTRLSPISASVLSNIANLIKEPIGIALSGEGRYAAGQVMGAISTMSDALQAGKKAFQNGFSVNGKTKLDGQIKDSAAEYARLDNLWEGVQKQLNANNATKRERTIAWWDYTRQRIAAHPLNGLAGRMFTGADEWSKVMYGGMTATGKAFREAGEKGIKRGTQEYKDLVQKHFNEEFLGGVKTGELNPDTGVDIAAGKLTFSNPIPRDGNFVDKAFSALQDSAQESQFWTYVSAFTRSSYNLMEQGGIMMASSLPIPSKRVKGHLLGSLIPRYRKTLNGDFGELAQLQLKGDIAFAHYTSMMVGGISAMGYMTGRNPDEGLPEMSFIVPTDNDKGYVSIPYGRLEPFATYFSVIADSVKAVRDNVISEQDYNQLILDIVAASGLATLDKSFMTGMGNMADLFDVRNFGSSDIISGTNTLSAPALSSVVPLGAGAAITRMISSYINPYETLGKDDPQRNLLSAISSALRQRHLSGIGNPIRYNPLNGEKELKVSMIGGKDRWLGGLQALVNEAIMPGKVKRGSERDIYRVLEIAGFDTNRFYAGVRTAEGIPLSLEQQSILLQDLHTYGGLATQLRREFKPGGPFDSKLKELERSRKDSSEEGQLRTARLEQEVQARISKVYADAKGRAVSVGRLSKDDRFLTSRLARNNSRRPQEAAVNASQDKRFNKQVQNILDFPVK